MQVLAVLRFEGFGNDSALPRWFREIVARKESDWLRMLVFFVTGEKDLPRAPKPEQLTVQVFPARLRTCPHRTRASTRSICPATRARRSSKRGSIKR